MFYFAGRKTGEAITVQRGQYRQQLTAWLQGHAELTIFGATQRYRQQLEASEDNWQEAQRRQAELTALSQAVMLLVSGIAVILMLWMAAAGVGGNTTPGALIALFVFCALASFEALAPVTGSFQHLGQVIASALRVTEITSQKPEVIFTEKTHAVPERVALEIHNLSFTYPEQSQMALRDISLQVEAGQHVAILGRTGCGKSTLLQLLTRAWEPQQGEIRLNGEALSQFDETALRTSTSVVSQRVHLFSATLRDNLLLAAPDAGDDELKQVLIRVGLEKLLDDSGLNSWLGEGGRQLSGGELRRLAIARALLHDAPLFLLDEPTEGLDAETERQILDLLAEVTKEKTVLMVTHRLRGLADFDNIIVMDNGQIIEQGYHADLMASAGRYYHFHQRL
ncbi:Lipid A export ATP-binding/permease protein MsbA [compost metagenome]